MRVGGPQIFFKKNFVIRKMLNDFRILKLRGSRKGVENG